MPTLPQTMELDFNNDRDATLKLIDWFEIERIRAAKVLVVGAGAIGNEVLKNLALLGLGNIYILDLDTIDVSNLSRSVLYRARDRGQSKAFTAAKAVTELNPNVNAFWLHGSIESDLGEGIVRDMDVVIGCLDNLMARFILNRLCRRVGRSWIDAGIGALNGQVRVYGPEGPCYECGMSSSDYEELGVGMSCNRVWGDNLRLGRVPTTPMIASLVAAIQVQECLKLLDPGRWRGRTLGGREFSFNGSVCGVEISGLPSRDDCYAHLSVSAVESLTMPALSAAATAGEVLSSLAALPDLVLTHLYLGPAPGPGAMGGQVALARRCACGKTTDICIPVGQLGLDQLPCACGEANFRWESDFETTNIVSLKSPQRLLDTPLLDLGIPRAGFVLARGAGGLVRVVELAADSVESLFIPSVLVIDLITPEETVLASSSIPGEMLVGAAVCELVDQLGLPQDQAEYSLFWPKQSATLDNERSLAECGVRSGDQIKLVAAVKVETPEGASNIGAISPSNQTVEVYVDLPGLFMRQKERFGRDTRVKDLIRILLEKYHLPAVVPRHHVDYSLFWEKQKTSLDSERSLAECSVRNGDRFKLVCSIMVEVDVSLPDGNTREIRRLDRDTRVEDLIRLLVIKYELPGFDNYNPASDYELRSQSRTGSPPPTYTLREWGILSNDTISLARVEVTAATLALETE